MWTEDADMKYVLLGADGSAKSEVFTAPAMLSDCKPILVDGSIVWYVTDDSTPFFFKLDPSAPEKLSVVHNGTVSNDVSSFVLASGGLGGDCTWSLTMSGLLTISGSGGEALSSSSPWAGYQDQIRELVIENGTEDIGSNAFRNYSSLVRVTLPWTIKSIGYNAFYGCDRLEQLNYMGDAQQWDAVFKSSTTGLENVTIAFHEHDYVKGDTVAPTCTKPGYMSYVCSECEHTYRGDEVAALGHDTELRNAKAATATEKGYTGDEICKVCGVTVKTGEVIPELGEEHTHSYTDVVTAPTCTEKGYTTHTCACGESYKDSYVNALGHKYENGVCVRCGEADPNADKPGENPFTDVSSEKYFYAPVMWAVNHEPQITGGYTDGTFRPQNTCTRAQIVTFLWRAKGCPAPAGNTCTFTDVAPGAYYYKAVLWAVENGITGGYDASTFGSNDTVTRAQAMTFLWRAAGKPAAPAGTVNTFTDVSPTSYYYEAVMWAVANGITGGYNAYTFGSNDGCTRGQIVTFLYRNMK